MNERNPSQPDSQISPKEKLDPILNQLNLSDQGSCKKFLQDLILLQQVLSLNSSERNKSLQKTLNEVLEYISKDAKDGVITQQHVDGIRKIIVTNETAITADSLKKDQIEDVSGEKAIDLNDETDRKIFRADITALLKIGMARSGLGEMQSALIEANYRKLDEALVNTEGRIAKGEVITGAEMETLQTLYENLANVCEESAKPAKPSEPVKLKPEQVLSVDTYQRQVRPRMIVQLAKGLDIQSEAAEEIVKKSLDKIDFSDPQQAAKDVARIVGNLEYRIKQTKGSLHQAVKSNEGKSVKTEPSFLATYHTKLRPTIKSFFEKSLDLTDTEAEAMVAKSLDKLDFSDPKAARSKIHEIVSNVERDISQRKEKQKKAFEKDEDEAYIENKRRILEKVIEEAWDDNQQVDDYHLDQAYAQNANYNQDRSRTPISVNERARNADGNVAEAGAVQQIVNINLGEAQRQGFERGPLQPQMHPAYPQVYYMMTPMGYVPVMPAMQAQYPIGMPPIPGTQPPVVQNPDGGFWVFHPKQPDAPAQDDPSVVHPLVTPDSRLDFLDLAGQTESVSRGDIEDDVVDAEAKVPTPTPLDPVEPLVPAEPLVADDGPEKLKKADFKEGIEPYEQAVREWLDAKRNFEAVKEIYFSDATKTRVLELRNILKNEKEDSATGNHQQAKEQLAELESHYKAAKISRYQSLQRVLELRKEKGEMTEESHQRARAMMAARVFGVSGDAGYRNLTDRQKSLKEDGFDTRTDAEREADFALETIAKSKFGRGVEALTESSAAEIAVSLWQSYAKQPKWRKYALGAGVAGGIAALTVGTLAVPGALLRFVSGAAAGAVVGSAAGKGVYALGGLFSNPRQSRALETRQKNLTTFDAANLEALQEAVLKTQKSADTAARYQRNVAGVAALAAGMAAGRTLGEAVRGLAEDGLALGSDLVDGAKDPQPVITAEGGAAASEAGIAISPRPDTAAVAPAAITGPEPSFVDGSHNYPQGIRPEVGSLESGAVPTEIHTIKAGSSISETLYEAWKAGKIEGLTQPGEGMSNKEFLAKMYTAIHELDNKAGVMDRMGVSSGDLDKVLAGSKVDLQPLIEHMQGKSLAEITNPAAPASTTNPLASPESAPAAPPAAAEAPASPVAEVAPATSLDSTAPAAGAEQLANQPVEASSEVTVMRAEDLTPETARYVVDKEISERGLTSSPETVKMILAREQLYAWLVPEAKPEMYGENMMRKLEGVKLSTLTSGSDYLNNINVVISDKGILGVSEATKQNIVGLLQGLETGGYSENMTLQQAIEQTVKYDALSFENNNGMRAARISLAGTPWRIPFIR